MTVTAHETQPLLRSKSNGSTDCPAPIAGHQYTEVNNTCIDAGAASDAFLVDFDPQGDVDNPLEWPTAFKWGIVALLALTAFTVCVFSFPHLASPRIRLSAAAGLENLSCPLRFFATSRPPPRNHNGFQTRNPHHQQHTTHPCPRRDIQSHPNPHSNPFTNHPVFTLSAR
jgi:hypothetical protein